MIKDLSQKSFPYLIGLMFLFPILKENISTFTVILFCVNVVVFKLSEKDYSFFKFKYLVLTIPFWIVFFNSILSNILHSNFSHVKHALLFLLIPFFFALTPKENFEAKNINFYLEILKNLCLLIIFIYLISYFINVPSWQYNVVFNNESRFRNYIYNDFKLFIIHPTYFTAILTLCSIHSLLAVVDEKKFYHLIYVFSFITITIMLLTKLILILMITELTIVILIKSKVKLINKIFLAIVFVGLILTISINMPGIKDRFIEVFESYNVKPKNNAYDSTNVRRAIFDSSVDIIKDNWVYGVGFDNLQSKLNEKYKENYNSSFFNNHDYMTHNYYFYILISTGIIGFLFYLFYLINIIKICFMSNIFLFKIFLFNALIVCFIEDYFYRQYGVLYFNLLLMCFIRYSELNNQNTETKTIIK